MTILSDKATTSIPESPRDHRGDEVDEKLVLYVFATLLLFENLTKEFSEARFAASLDPDYSISTENLLFKAYTEACKMRAWKRKTNDDLIKKLKQK